MRLRTRCRPCRPPRLQLPRSSAPDLCRTAPARSWSELLPGPCRRLCGSGSGYNSMPLRAASPASDDRGGTWIEQAPWSYGKPNVVVSVKHRPPRRSLASRMPNFHLVPAIRRAAAIPAGPAPTIKTSKSGSDRRPARAGLESADARPATALRRVSSRVGDAGVISPPTQRHPG